MKTRLGVLIFVFLTGIIFGVGQPALLYGMETPTGNAWDPFIKVSFFTGKAIPPKHLPFPITLSGRLSIAYGTSFSAFCPPGATSGPYLVTMFYTLTLSDGDQSNSPQLYTSFTPGTCEGDIGTPGSGGQGDVIMGFLKTVVLQIFPNAKDAYLKSVSNTWTAPDAFAFEADIKIVVKH
jgi:hypothetical protein